MFFPQSSYCLLCGKMYHGSALRGACQECLRELRAYTQAGQSCPCCGYFARSKVCPNCGDRGIEGLKAVISTAPYQGQYRELIQHLKYSGCQEIGQGLGYLMAHRLRQAYPRLKPDLIIPVPLDPQRHLIRGFNQSSLLAAAVSRIIGCPVNEDYLFRSPGGASQTTLDRTQRLANARNAFYLREQGKLHNKVIVLVDDIITTGATLGACAQTLAGGGAGEIWGLTWAAGIRQEMKK